VQAVAGRRGAAHSVPHCRLLPGSPADPKADKAPTTIHDDESVIEHMVGQLQAVTQQLAASYKLNPVQFEKVRPARPPAALPPWCPHPTATRLPPAQPPARPTMSLPAG
jgi:hypothetical protein